MSDKQKDNPNSDILKQFLLSLVATTISIILTFGIASLIDDKKKEDAKREIVLMVMYDMQQSITMAAECDSNLSTFFNNQVDIIANPEKFPEASKMLIPYFPKAKFPRTTENIFNSSIETINTVGSILFVQHVSEFYGFRQEYTRLVIEDFEANVANMLYSYDNLASFDSRDYPLISQSILGEMEKLFNQCKALMKVSDKELSAFAMERKRLLEATADSISDDKELKNLEKLSQRTQQLEQAREQGRKKQKQQ